MSRLRESDLNGYHVTTMREIGVRELKASLAEILRSVEAGEPVRVTRHGRPIAEIVPPRSLTLEERIDGLAAQGLITKATTSGPLQPVVPTKLPEGVDGGSALILAERESYYDDEP